MDITRSVLVAVRGVRGKAKKAWTAPISNVSFNLIPEEKSYEGLLMIYDCALPIASLDLIDCIYKYCLTNFPLICICGCTEGYCLYTKR